MHESQEKHKQTLNNKITSIRTKLQRLTNKVSDIQEMRIQKEEDVLNELIDKVKEKEKKNLEFAKKKERITEQRMARIKAKNEVFKGLTKKIQNDEQNRVLYLQERLRKSQERIEQQRVREIAS